MFDLLTLQSVSPLYLIGIVLLLLIGYYNALKFQEKRKVIALGGYGARAKSRWPLGLDWSYTLIRSQLSHRALEWYEEAFASSGHSAAPFTVDANLGGRRTIFTTDLENIKAVLATQFTDFGKGDDFHDAWKSFLGDSIFTTDGELWKTSRALIRPQFVRERVSDLNVFERHVQSLFKHLDHDGRPVKLVDMMLRFSLDAATDFLLGQSVNSLQEGANSFAKAFGEVQRMQGLIYYLRISKLDSLYPRHKFNKHLTTLNAFVDPLVTAALSIPPAELAKRTESSGMSDRGYTFLHAVAATNRDPSFIRDQLVAVLLAGRDTTASTLSWLFYELSRHPGVLSRLRSEVASVVGLDPAVKPTYVQLKSMKYLQNTLSEILRLYPVIPLNVREALQDTTLPRGGGADGVAKVGVPKGTAVVFNIFSLQLQAEWYQGSDIDPMLFEPDRWRTWQPKAWSYIPFLGGPRICVGQQFALMEMSYTVVRILQRFSRLELVSPLPAGSLSHSSAEKENMRELRFQNGRESYAWRRSRESAVGFKTDIQLMPSKEIWMVFHRE